MPAPRHKFLSARTRIGLFTTQPTPLPDSGWLLSENVGMGLPVSEAEGARDNSLVIWDDQTPKKRRSSPQDDMTSMLSIELVSELPKGDHSGPTRDTRQSAHRFTSTTSSSIDGGMGSSRAFRLSRYPAIAS